MTKVVVAMSGGVDSSVAAALLKEQGYDVVGMMLRLWSEPGKEESNRCCTPDSMAQARRVAARLAIPFYVVDAKDVFQFLSGVQFSSVQSFECFFGASVDIGGSGGADAVGFNVPVWCRTCCL